MTDTDKPMASDGKDFVAAPAPNEQVLEKPRRARVDEAVDDSAQERTAVQLESLAERLESLAIQLETS